jgi:hypothetical protein
VHRNRKHIKKSKGERLHWKIASGGEATNVVYISSLEGRFLQPAHVSDKRGANDSVRSKSKLLVP